MSNRRTVVERRLTATRGPSAGVKATAGGSGLWTLWRIVIVAALAGAVAVALARKPNHTASPLSQSPVSPAIGHTTGAGLPRLVDVGADRCIPCKAMAPILDELRSEYAGRMQIEFVDVWKNPGAGEAYGVSAIPTQIFIDAEGRELHRHQGFISKADILATWKRVGYDFAASPRSAS